MSIQHLEMMQHYANVICVKYPEKPWKRVQSRHADMRWETMNMHPAWLDNCDYRFIPETITLNGVELPEPLRVEPKDGSRVYCLGYTSGVGLSLPIQYSEYYKWHFDSGLLHSTREAAQAWLDAITKVARGEG